MGYKNQYNTYEGIDLSPVEIERQKELFLLALCLTNFNKISIVIVYMGHLQPLVAAGAVVQHASPRLHTWKSPSHYKLH